MKMKNFLLPVAMMLFCIGLGAQNDSVVRQLEGDIVMVRLIERTPTSFWQSRMIISDGSGESQSILLQRIGNNSIMDDNVRLIAKIFNEITRQGYSLSVPPASNMSEGSTLYFDYFFNKDKKQE
jgi:hypothetical protein